MRERAAGAAAFLGLLLAAPDAPAQTPYLLGDLNAVPAGPGRTGDGAPLEPVLIGDLLYFTGEDGAAGRVLWRSDGTPAGTRPVRDPATGPFAPRRLMPVRGGVAFWGNGAGAPTRLWSSDGSAAGTMEISDVQHINCPDPILCNMHSAGGVAFFTGYDAVHSAELWRTDGSTFGTYKVHDIWPGTDGSNPQSIVDLGGRLFFFADDSLTGPEPWTSDGTGPGTQRLVDLCPGSCYPGLRELGVAHATVFFFLENGLGDLWGSEGTGPTMRLVKRFTALVRRRVFCGNESAGRDLAICVEETAGVQQFWLSDGTTAGTRRPRDVAAGGPRSPRAFTLAGRHLFFVAEGPAGTELWRSDGSQAGTVMVADLVPGAGSSTPGPLVAVGGGVYFLATDASGERNLWRSDGSEAGTTRVATLCATPGTCPASAADPRWFQLLGPRLLFRGNDGRSGEEPWALDLPVPPRRLLRNTALRGLDPPAPALASILPLDAARDAYLRDLHEGGADPDTGILADAGRPLVFYALEGAGRLQLARTPFGQIQLRY